MAYFLQLEKTTSAYVLPNEAIIFDSVVTKSEGSEISYDNQTGGITFNVAGDFLINWYLANQTGLTKTGISFSIINESEQNPRTFKCSNHYKIAPTSGFAVVHVETPGETIKLKNTCTWAATLSDITPIKAGILVYSGDEKPKIADNIDVQLTSDLVLENDEPVPFDIVQTNKNITLDTQTSEITIQNRGLYMVTWQVPVDGTDVEGFVRFSVYVNDAKISESYLPMPLGMITGSSVITADANSKVKLVNTTNDKVSLMNLAKMTVVKISDFPVEASAEETDDEEPVVEEP